jgi:hypothetical protein
MTLNQLHKIVSAQIAAGHGRCLVSVDKGSFQHNCESDGCTILALSGVAVGPVAVSDDDGGIATNKDGTERYRKTAVLYGNMGCSAFGDSAGPKP